MLLTLLLLLTRSRRRLPINNWPILYRHLCPRRFSCWIFHYCSLLLLLLLLFLLLHLLLIQLLLLLMFLLLLSLLLLLLVLAVAAAVAAAITAIAAAVLLLVCHPWVGHFWEANGLIGIECCPLSSR
jgi:hypothetical protein